MINPRYCLEPNQTKRYRQLDDRVDSQHQWHFLQIATNSTNYSSQQAIVDNLSADTSYEFFVRAKNVIGEGTASEIVIARTKQVSGNGLGILQNSSPEQHLAGPNMLASNVMGKSTYN